MFGQLFEVLAESVTVRDLSGELVFANRAALRSMGFGSLEELRARGTAAIMADYVVEDERGRSLTHAELPSNRVIRGEHVRPELIRAVHIATGEVSWSLLKASPLADEDDRLIGAITVIEDVTAVKTAEVQTRVLAESGRILASSLDYEQTLRNVADIAVPAIADFCGVDLLDEYGVLERVAVSYGRSLERPLSDRLLDVAQVAPGSSHPARRVLTTGTTELYADLSASQLAALSRGPSAGELLRELEVRSLMYVPMRVPARTIGVLTLASASSGRRLHHDDVELAEQLGRRAAVAVENSRLHTKLAGVAEMLQLSLLPRRLPSVPGWEVASLYRPAETQTRIDVGGDFYEFFEHDGTWFLIVGDVTGKGVRAASTTALMRHGARVACRSDPRPSGILGLLDEALAQQPGDSLCTALCLCLHPERVVLSSAGHPRAIHVTSHGELREAPTPGPLLGAFPDGAWPEEELRVGPGDLLVLYTDGVTEAVGEEGRFGLERFRSLLAGHVGSPPRDVLDALERALADFSVTPLRDDIAALALRPVEPAG
jgi:PAS domain S-box-containing protein